jgi:hypothetical protein
MKTNTLAGTFRPDSLSNSRRLLLLSFVVLVALAISVRLSAHASQAPKPIIITFDAPGAATVSSPACGFTCGTLPEANNAEGAIVGFYTDANVVPHGFLRNPDGHIISFDAPGAGLGFGLDQGTVAYSINDWGEIAGQFQDSNYVFHGFVRYPDGSFNTFDAPGAGTGAFEGTAAQGINSAGDVTGIYSDANGLSHGFLRDRNGTITTFDAPGAFQFMSTGIGEAINSGEKITGYFADANNVVHGFLRDRNGVFTTFDAPGAGTGHHRLEGTAGLAINSQGDITGFDEDANNVDHGFLRDHNRGTITTFDAPGAGTVAPQGTVGEGINVAGNITGFYQDVNNVYHGFVRDRDGTFTKFDPPGTGTIPFSGTFAYAINDGGVITGNYLDNSNLNHGFLRSP